MRPIDNGARPSRRRPELMRSQKYLISSPRSVSRPLLMARLMWVLMCCIDMVLLYTFPLSRESACAETKDRYDASSNGRLS